MSLSRPDPSSPNQVSSASFTPSRKGFDQGEVRDFLRMVAAELARLQEREKFLEREVRAAQRNTPSAAVLDEEVVTRMLGEEAARILSTAREGATAIKQRTEEVVNRLLREANDEAQRVREEAYLEAERIRRDAAADAEAEISMAKQQGRDMVNETRAYRERVLSELSRRRELARQQIEQLVHGRDRLMQAFERARLAAIDVMGEMSPLGEPDEYVNLSPTTGPVPLMVPNMPAPDAVATAPTDEAVDIEVEPTDVEVEVAEVETVSLDEMGDTVEVVDFFDMADTEAAGTEAVDTEAVDTEAVGTEVVDTEAEVIESSLDMVDTEELEVVDDEHEPADGEGQLAPVVALFEPQPVIIEEADIEPRAEEPHAEKRTSVDDLFAKLRASRTDTVVSAAEPVVEASLDTKPEEVTSATVAEKPSVFTPSEPEQQPAVAALPVDASAFEKRDAELTPLIVAAGRKLKRVLADEQNDVLHALRGKKGFDPSVLLPPLEEHAERYSEAVLDELRAAAVAGAATVDNGTESAHLKAVQRTGVLAPAIELLTFSVVQPLRDRVDRAVADTDGDATELGNAVRAIYREWKTQRIDEHLDDVALSAFGHGQLAVLAPGTKVCWAVDPNGPACPDAEDNSLAGAVSAGDEFPTAHRCAPAHEGCRCMLQRVPR